MLAAVVRGLVNAIHWITSSPVDSAVRFTITYSLDSGLSVRYRYLRFMQLGPSQVCCGFLD